MPQQLQIGGEIRKLYNGTEYVIRYTGPRNFQMNGESFTGLTAVAQRICGDNHEDARRASAATWRFFDLDQHWNGPRQVRAPRADGTVDQPLVTEYKVGGKCKHEGCYEPADCKHGFCHNHCHRHSVGEYNARRMPRTDKVHIGVEIEVQYARPEDFRRGVGIECHRDGSLGSYGAEYKLLATADRVVGEACELVEQLWKRRARVNRQCGLHVHLDARQIGSERRAEWQDWAKRTQDVWFSLVPPSRRSNGYIRRLNGDEYNDESHYAWFHFSSYNTCEVRLHGGTLNPHKVAGWLVALVHLRAKAGDAAYAFPSTGDAEADFWAVFEDCPQVGKEYLATRKANGGVIRDSAYGTIEE